MNPGPYTLKLTVGGKTYTQSLAVRHDPKSKASAAELEEQLQTGVNENYVRLSIGIEHEDDILADLSQALDAA